MTILMQDVDVGIDTTEIKVESNKKTEEKEEEYKFEYIQEEPIEIDTTPGLSTIPIDNNISLSQQADLFLLMGS